MGQTERDEDEIRADLFFLPFILYHPYFILALTATATRYATPEMALPRPAESPSREAARLEALAVSLSLSLVVA